MRPPCLKANFAMASAAAGLMVALGQQAAGCLAALGWIQAAAFLLLLGLAWRQRTVERQVNLFGAENDELRETRKQIDGEIGELREARQAIDAELDELREARTALDSENEELKHQVSRLNRLHNESVAMIQNLALYGDKCKQFGKELKTVSTALKQTDNSLGLTAEEFASLLPAFQAAAAAMR